MEPQVKVPPLNMESQNKQQITRTMTGFTVDDLGTKITTSGSLQRNRKGVLRTLVSDASSIKGANDVELRPLSNDGEWKIEGTLTEQPDGFRMIVRKQTRIGNLRGVHRLTQRACSQIRRMNDVNKYSICAFIGGVYPRGYTYWKKIDLNTNTNSYKSGQWILIGTNTDLYDDVEFTEASGSNLLNVVFHTPIKTGEMFCYVPLEHDLERPDIAINAYEKGSFDVEKWNVQTIRPGKFVEWSLRNNSEAELTQDQEIEQFRLMEGRDRPGVNAKEWYDAKAEEDLIIQECDDDECEIDHFVEALRRVRQRDLAEHLMNPSDDELDGQCGFDPKNEQTEFNDYNDMMREFAQAMKEELEEAGKTGNYEWVTNMEFGQRITAALQWKKLMDESRWQICGPPGQRELTGQSKITKSGLLPKSFSDAATISTLVSAVGMANPSSGIEGASESQKPPGDETFDAGLTVIDAIASEVQIAGPVIADTISASYAPQPLSSGIDGYRSEVAEWSYAKVASRPIIILTTTWDTTQATGDEIGRFRMPQDLDALNNIVTSTMKQHAFVRWTDVVFTLHFNANQFVAGWARLSNIPSEYYDDASSNYIRALTSAGSDINASSMSQAILKVPFCYNQSWISTAKIWEMAMAQTGVMGIYCILPLKGVEGDSPSLPLRITMNLEGLKLAAPIPPLTNLFAARDQPPSVFELDGEMDLEQMWSEVYKEVSEEVDRLECFAQLPGSEVCAEIEEKPQKKYWWGGRQWDGYTYGLFQQGLRWDDAMRELTGENEEDTASVVYYPRSNAFGNYEAGISILKNVTSEGPVGGMTQTTEDPMDIKMLMSKPGIIRYFPWSIDNDPGTVLLTLPVTPIQDGEYVRPQTPLAYFARWGVRWRGSVKYKWMVAKSAFHTGKAAIVQAPLYATVTGDNYMSFNHIIFDLKEDTVLEFEVSFMSDHAVLRIPHLFSAGSTSQYNFPGITYGSNLYIIVHTKLQANAAMQPIVDTALWISAGRSFQLYNINPPDFTAATSLQFVNNNSGGAPYAGRQLNIGGNAQWLIPAIQCISGGIIADGHYQAAADISLDVGVGGSGSPPFTWTGRDLYAIGGYWVSNYPFLDVGTQAANIDVTSTVPVSIVPISGLELTGQTGVESAMHDKLQTPIPMLGYEDDSFSIPNQYEELNTLLQILERPHAYSFGAFPTMLLFANRTGERVDAFEMFGTCFAFTTGTVQWMVHGSNMVADPLLEPVHVGAVNSFLTGGVLVPQTMTHVKMVDSPPMTDATLCMNRLGDFQTQVIDARCILTAVRLVGKDANATAYVRAGPGFSYHYWCGIPTPTQQTMTARKHAYGTMQFEEMSLVKRIQDLRTKEAERIAVELVGQMERDEKPKSPQEKLRKMFSKSKKDKAPKTEAQVQVQSCPGNPFEESQDDEEEFENASQMETDSELEAPEIQTSTFVPKPAVQTLQAVSNVATKIANNSTKMKSTFKDIRDDIRTTRQSVARTSEKIQRAVEKAAVTMAEVKDNLTSEARQSKEKFYDTVDAMKNNIKNDGLFSFLFGKDEDGKSKLIQILLVDALECVTIRTPVKWIGMLVKLGIAMGLTRTLVNMIVNFVKSRTLWSTPNESQQEDLVGEAMGMNLPMICSLISALVMFAGFAYSGGTCVDKKKLPTMWDWVSERARQMNAIDRGMESCFKVFEKINKWTVKFVRKFMPLDEKAFACLNEEAFLDRSRKIMEAATPLFEVKQMIKIFCEPTLRKKVFEIDAMYVEWLQLSADPEVSRKHSSLCMKVERVVKELRNRIITITDRPPVRIDPWFCKFFGGSGMGKSYLTSVVAYVLGRSQNVPVEDLFYPRAQGMEFWDDYHGQEFIGFDDIDQIDDQEFALEIIMIKSNIPKVLPMAHLETKGAMFMSRGMLGSSNQAFPEPKAVKCKKAYKRRVNRLVECVQVTEAQKLDQSHFKFVYRDPLNSNAPPLTDQMNFPEMCHKLAVEYSQYLKIQHRLIKAVVPDAQFKPLYLYQDDDASRLKIFELVQEVIDRTLDETDQYIRDIAEIKTRQTEMTYPEQPNGQVVDFEQELVKVPRKKLTVEVDSDDEESDHMEDDFDEEFIYGGGPDELRGEMDIEGETTGVRIKKTEQGEWEIVEVEGVPSRVRAVLREIPHPDEEDAEPLTWTQSLVDVVHTLSGGCIGRNYRELPEELPCPDHQIRDTLEGARKMYVDLRGRMRSARLFLYKDSTDAYFDKLFFCLNGYLYYCAEVEADYNDRKASFIAAMYATYFLARLLVVMSKIVGHNLQLGFLSRMTKNLNDRIMPDNLMMNGVVDGMRAVNEIALTPVAVILRIAHESIAYCWRGLKYLAKTIYRCISEKTTPEGHMLMKIGLFLVGGFVLYQTVLGQDTMFKRKFFGKKGPKDPNADQEKQAELLGETSESPNLTPEILTRMHLGMPRDGAKYTHYHQCEKCTLIFKHTHAWTERTPTYQLLCKPCMTKINNAVTAVRKQGTSQDYVTSEDQVITEDLGGEAVSSSGGQMKEKFAKRLKLRGQADELKKKFKEGSEKVTVPSSAWKKWFRVYDEEETKPELQGQAEDAQLLQMLPMVENNCASFHIGGVKCNMIFLAAKWAVTVMHMLVKRDGVEVPYLINWKGQSFHGLLNTYTHTRRPKVSHIFGENIPEDCVYINFEMNRTLPYFKDIRHHIPSSEEFELIDQCRGILVEKDRNTANFYYHPITKIRPIVDRTIGTQAGQDIGKVRTAVALAWEYKAETKPGTCGSPLFAKNSGLQKKLIGFHISNLGGTSLGYSYPLFREQVDEMLRGEELTGQCITEDIEKQCSEVYNCFPEELPITHTLKYVPEGRVLIIGKLKPEHKLNLPRKSDIVGSPHKDEIYHHTTEPAILTDNDPRSPGDIVQRGINKFGKVHPNKRPRRIMEKIISHKVKQLERNTVDYNGPLRTLTEYEAINGIIGQKYIPPLRMDTSPGYPYTKLRKSGETGRSFLFNVTGEKKDGGLEYEAGPLLRRHLDEIWEGLRVGVIRHNYFVDTLKDERRTMHRLYKTRFFNVHNVAWLITYRRLYLALSAYRLSMKFRNGSGLGLDTTGPEVSQMMNLFLSKGTKFLMTDVAEWDGNCSAEDVDDSFEVDNRFMKGREADPDNNKRRETFRKSACQRIHIIEDTVYLVLQGIPSGRGDTADRNTQVHDELNYANWIEIFELAFELLKDEKWLEMATCEAKDEHTAEIAVGDDGGGTVSDDACEYYNEWNIEKVFKHYGTACTPPNKIEGQELPPFVSVDEFEFLKSTFRRDPEFRSIWHMQMAPKVIRELTNWVTIHGDPYDLFYSNMDDALRMAFHHGREFFEQYKTDVNTVLARKGDPLLTMDYGDAWSDFFMKFGKLL